MARCSMSHCGMNRPFFCSWQKMRKAGETMTRPSVARSLPHSQRSGADDPPVALGDACFPHERLV